MNNYLYDNGMKEAIEQISKEKQEIVEKFQANLKDLDIEYRYLKLKKTKNTLNIFLDDKFLQMAKDFEHDKNYIITTAHNPLDMNPSFLMRYQAGWLLFNIQYQSISVLDRNFKMQYQIKKRLYNKEKNEYDICFNHAIINIGERENIRIEIDKEAYCFIENNNEKTLYLDYSGFNKITEINFGVEELTCHIKNSSIENIVFDLELNFKSLTVGKKYIKNYELPFKQYQSFDKYTNDMKEHQIVYQLMKDKGFKYMSEKEFENIKSLAKSCTKLDFDKIKELEQKKQNIVNFFNKKSIELFDISSLKRARIYNHFVEKEELEYFFRKIQKVKDLISKNSNLIPIQLAKDITTISQQSTELYKIFNQSKNNDIKINSLKAT